MPRTIAILQSSYIPWKGYFDMIACADEFILYDSVQYTTRDWRSRNRVKTSAGAGWLTIPVHHKGLRLQSIRKTKIIPGQWAKNHLKTIEHAYARAPYMDHYLPWLHGLYHRAAAVESLSEVNHLFITAICAELGIQTPIVWDSHYPSAGEKSQRLLNICRQAKADVYLSGPAAKVYLDIALFAAAGIEVHFADYQGYREYPQLHGTFDHFVSVLDLLLNTGPGAADYLRQIRPGGRA